MSQPPVPFDWLRLLWGDAPSLFYLEIVFRTLVIFAWLILLLRLTGKRSLAQLSAIEFALVIALGSAAGDPMFYPQVPLLQTMLVIGVVIGLQQGMAYLIRRSERVETFLEDRPSELVRSGRVQLEELERAKLSFEDLCETLRNNQVRQLGEVQRAYLEQNGQPSIFVHPPGQAPPGLPVVPPWDLQAPIRLTPGAQRDGPLACVACGEVTTSGHVPRRCEHCGQRDGWTYAVTDPLDETLNQS